MADLNVQEVDGAVVFGVKVVPASSRTVISGVLDGMLKIKVAAAAEKGKANKCLVGFLAKKLNVKTNAILIISGRTAPVKRLQIQGLSPDDLLKKVSCDDR